MIVWNLILAASVVIANPLERRSFQVPNTNGFPNPNAQQELAIAQQAGGKLPAGPLPTKLGPNSATAFQLIAANELFETAFFSSLLNNITSGAKGFAIPKDKLAASTTILKTILAQEQQHAIAARAVLKTAGVGLIPGPCKYQFGSANTAQALNTIETVTAVVLGALQGANQIFAEEGVAPLVRVVSSVIGQEGEQNGFYRISLDQVPSESPFLTFVPAPFAWSALQQFTVPGSCPYNVKDVNLPIFPPLHANGATVAQVKPQDQVIKFTADIKDCKGYDYKNSKNLAPLYITYTTGQQKPFSVQAKNVQIKGSVVTLEANFPYSSLIAAGFSHAALTTSNNFNDANDVPSKTLAAPAVIQVVKPIGFNLFSS